MYVGRFVVVGPEVGAYRVSSRSFPNREITARDEALTVGPTADAPETDNPYVSYNCLRVVDTPTGETVAFGNGSHVDPIAEKLELGYPARDALAESLLALDYEKDDYDTPRIAATIGGGDDGEALIGTVRKDALLVETVDEPTLVATYEKNAPESFADEFTAESAADAASEAYDLEFEHAVCAAGVARTDDGFETAIENGD
ncbi:IMP cyclohydrolase [Natronolimnohabitans innermongolicus]|uniref:IMP cyclohydrolase n=1 Tax=Natronolimnohabitans innermongolicus JCM 12255 TaxID=1227499 RepID=L9WZG0_9EURY|nr:IMP cyclohydrolase [Natronolimnohabitans innermongolicus]ELY54860.1 IMP cyclohydrolase [Natronolimnohabitans innermongolicus JCM 12255]